MKSVCAGRAAVALALFSLPLAAQSDSITATPAALSFTYQAGGALPAEQKVQIKRGGSGPALDFTAAAPAPAPWLIVAPAAGKTGTTLGVRVNPTSLLAGTYTAAVQVTAASAANPAVINVTLTIKNPPPTPAVLPAALDFKFQTDQAAPDPKTITVASNGEPLAFTAAISGASWLSVSPAIGIAVTGSPVTLNAAVDTTGLVPGSYTARLTLTFPNAAVKNAVIPVTLTVTAGAASVTSIWPNAAPVGSADATITIRGRHFFQSSVVQAGTIALATTWVSTSVLLAGIPKSLFIDPGTLAITVTNAPQAASAAVNFTVTPPGPVIGSVVNAASFASGSTPALAPGEIVSIFGSGLGPGTVIAADASGGAFPTSLGEPPTVVEFELSPNTWTSAPIIFAQTNQVNVVTPFAMTAATGRRLRVTYNKLASQPFLFDAVDADPGLFTTDSSGRGQAAALNYNEAAQSYSLNSSSNAAPKGSVVAFYATGGGAMTPAPSDGQVLPATGTPAKLNGDVSVTIGGDGATVLAATAVPGSLAGLVQINVTVPSSIKPGKDVPVVVSIAGRAGAATATIAVK